MCDEAGISVAARHLRTCEDIDYLSMDTERATGGIVRGLAAMEGSIWTRTLF